MATEQSEETKGKKQKTAANETAVPTSSTATGEVEVKTSTPDPAPPASVGEVKRYVGGCLCGGVRWGKLTVPFLLCHSFSFVFHVMFWSLQKWT
jgi:hypothetical protein